MGLPKAARVLLLLTVIHAQIYDSWSDAGDTRTSTLAALQAAREARQRQTAIYSGATSSSYTATTLDHESDSANSNSGSTLTSPGAPGPVTGLNQPQVQFPQAAGGGGGYHEVYQQAVDTGCDRGAECAYPPALASGFDFSTLQMNSVLRPGEYVPNCGCVPRGSCSREIGQYTRLVGLYSDVVCGYNFERCCFDGPCPGVLDEFVRAAPCVPQEQCLRPYGVLPTDVRDFGIIAPCPGQGAVRCITVDNLQLLEFQAAVAAIEASRFEAATAQAEAEENVVVSAPPAPVLLPPRPQPQPQPQPQPERVVVPIITAPEPAPAPLPPPAPQPHAVSSVSTFTPVSGQTTTVTTGGPTLEEDRELVSNIATLLASNGIIPAGAGAAATTVSKGEIGTIVSRPSLPVRPAPVRVPVSVPATVTTTTSSVVAPPTSGFIQTPAVGGGYRFDCRASGCYTPWAYRGGLGNFGLNYPSGIYKRFRYGYPGYGLGGGLGFSKSFQFSKGFNVLG